MEIKLPTRKPDISLKFSDVYEEIEYFQRKDHYNVVKEDDRFMQRAKEAAIKYSLTPVFPIGIVAVKNNQVLAEAGNGNGYHEKNFETPGHRKGCVRRFLNDEREKEGIAKFKGGEGFGLCPGCHTDSHAEANLTRNAKEKNIDLEDSDIFMYGHFWCCKPCWEKLLAVGVKNVYIVENAENFANKELMAKWAEEVRLKKEGTI
jgi:deoxycytidylate deaminase